MLSATVAQPVLDESQIINPQDLAYIKTIPDADQREVVVCSIRNHRRPDKLAVGDSAPPLDLTDLDRAETKKTVNLAAVSDRPLVLFFGSYT